MKKLMNRSKNVELASDVKIASSFFSRAKGLLGARTLPEGNALWIHHCNSIHTWFMRFPIDVVFVDDRMIVRKVCEHVGPWRMTMPSNKLKSVFEMPAGTVSRRPVEIGDELHVGD
jgi:uncharacterized membrane protein (UPF0127 family)